MATTRSLDAIWAHVNYFRCDRCGAVWNLPKDDPIAGRDMVTAPPDRVVARRRLLRRADDGRRWRSK
jgi:hypothetical protein